MVGHAQPLSTGTPPRTSITHLDCSRPRPLCLTPPNGATSLVMATSFTPTMPERRRCGELGVGRCGELGVGRCGELGARHLPLGLACCPPGSDPPPYDTFTPPLTHHPQPLAHQTRAPQPPARHAPGPSCKSMKQVHTRSCWPSSPPLRPSQTYWAHMQMCVGRRARGQREQV